MNQRLLTTLTIFADAFPQVFWDESIQEEDVDELAHRSYLERCSRPYEDHHRITPLGQALIASIRSCPYHPSPQVIDVFQTLVEAIGSATLQTPEFKRLHDGHWQVMVTLGSAEAATPLPALRSLSLQLIQRLHPSRSADLSRALARFIDPNSNNS